VKPYQGTEGKRLTLNQPKGQIKADMRAPEVISKANLLNSSYNVRARFEFSILGFAYGRGSEVVGHAELDDIDLSIAILLNPKQQRSQKWQKRRVPKCNTAFVRQDQLFPTQSGHRWNSIPNGATDPGRNAHPGIQDRVGQQAFECCLRDFGQVGQKGLLEKGHLEWQNVCEGPYKLGLIGPGVSE
jgi:hypothetical protein